MQIDYRDREHDSDDELKQEMMTYDDRLTIINRCDYRNYLNLNKGDKPLEQAVLL
jgi:hypothetical protein